MLTTYVTVLVVLASLGHTRGNCPINPCDLGLCAGVRCVLDSITCQHECVTPSADVTTSAPPSGGDITAATSPLPDVTTTPACTLSCPRGHQCVYLGFGGLAACLPTTTDSSVTPPIGVVTRENNVCNASHYEPPPNSEHECGLPCQYGVCRAVGGAMSCQCDPGAVGQICQHECCLGCSGRGDCIYNTALQEPQCNCEVGYSGADCSVDPPHRENNVCNTSFYEPPDEWENECGLPCVHGVCRNIDGGFLCVCDPGSDGFTCQHECCVDCNGQGDCFYNTIIEEAQCNCLNNFTGPACLELVTQPSLEPREAATWYRWVAGVSGATLLVLLVLLVLLPYVMWRHRVILVMKIIHYFQNYEDDDERQWDAFVSYKSSAADEKFVVHTLLPKLESQLGFRLHVHFRDFMPGDTVANNIIRAVLGSRRTILVVSPEFVRSEWTKFEYQVAQQEMLKRKHRIIPVLLEDLADCKDNIDPNLKVILDAVTYLEWPGADSEKKQEKFWKRLQLSLPKKRAAAPPPTDEGVELGLDADNAGYDTIRPDDVDVTVVSEKGDQGLHNGYVNGGKYTDPAEEYDTINEAEMNDRNTEINNRNADVNVKDVDGFNAINADLYDKNLGLNDVITDLKEGNHSQTCKKDALNEEDGLEKTSARYVKILNGNLQPVDV